MYPQPNTVWIYSGLPGGGKSTLIAQRHPYVPVCSSDHWFMNKNSGVYTYVPAEIGDAHGACLRKFVGLVTRKTDVVVDNTNTSAIEVATYANLALAYGRKLQIITVQCDPEVAFARNVHGVSRETIAAMHKQLSERVLAPWWPHETITNT